jgi:hypothetical protein
MARMEPLPLFCSLNRFIDHEVCISAGSAEICRASFVLDVIGEDANGSVKRAVEGKLDTCGSVSLSLSHSSHLQDIKDCRKHGLKEVVLSGIGGKSKPLREAGVLHVDLRRKEGKSLTRSCATSSTNERATRIRFFC